ncbi:prepilin peptidase [Leptospirillum ferriphilum]|uniref:Prepilin type IV endopeptidase peptidase domain-containing protein n=1 Tax=Leptospirillum ferriphilum TaxID=178606 RepID=A0A1V3SWX0_9BACT|nr:prepilin peptidase [Leptospirillum ferriphilum]OOH72772.1 hypothetical protein BOX24_05130 [Leptospirillum ferriphilum]
MAPVLIVKILAYASFSLALSMTDIRLRRLPHALTLPMTGLGILFSFLPGNGLSPGASFLGFLSGILPLGILAWNRRKTFGFGDAVFSGAIGAFSGVMGLGIALFSGGLMALAVVRALGKKGIFPFGPFLAMGGLAGIFLTSAL